MSTKEHVSAATVETQPDPLCPLCAKSLAFVKDIRYCARCRVAGVGADGQDDDPLPEATISKLKKASQDANSTRSK